MLKALIASVCLTTALVGCSQSSTDGAPTPDASGIPGVKTYTDLARNHVTTKVDYPQSPPVGGTHWPIWATCMGDVYTKPLINEKAVHSMEHGAVWIAYDPSLSRAEVRTLASLIDGRAYTMMSPYPGLTSPVVITAWGTQLAVDSVDDPRLAEFVDMYAHGPQTPEANAPCTPATGSMSPAPTATAT